MNAIGPGDWVECVDASPYEGQPSPLVVGQTYEILAVHDFLPHRGDPSSAWFDCAVSLVGVPDPADHLAWGLYRFRPVGGDALLRDLLQPIDAKVDA